MEKTEIIKIYEEISKNYPEDFTLEFDEEYPNDNANGGISSNHNVIVINWVKMKDADKDKWICFFKHELGHDIHYRLFMSKIRRIRELSKLVEEEIEAYSDKSKGESIADELGEEYYKMCVLEDKKLSYMDYKGGLK